MKNRLDINRQQKTRNRFFTNGPRAVLIMAGEKRARQIAGDNMEC